MADVEEGAATEPLIAETVKEGSSSFLPACFGAKHSVLFYVAVAASFVTVVMLPITFLVIIPDIARQQTDAETITLLSMEIINPTSVSFQTDTTLQFSDKAMAPATAKMKTTQIHWKEVVENAQNAREEELTQLASFDHANGLHITTQAQHMKADAHVYNDEFFSHFNDYVMGAGDFDWNLKGAAEVRTLGVKVNVHLDKVVKMHGYNDFPQHPIISNVKVLPSTFDSLNSKADTLLFSPSNILVTFGQDLHFKLKSNGIIIAIGTVNDARFQQGNFSVVSHVAMQKGSEEETAELMKVIGNFMGRVDTPMTMEAFYLDSPVSWLVSSLHDMHLPSVLPAVKENVIDLIDMYVNIGSVINTKFGLKMYNPIDETMIISRMECSIVFEDKHLATVDEQSLNIVQPPKQQIQTSVDMSARIDLKHIKVIMDLLKKKSGFLDLDCQITANVGEFVADIPYKQLQVPAALHEFE